MCHSLRAAKRKTLISAIPEFDWWKVVEPKPRFLSFKEAARVVEASKREPLARATIVVALNTGLRLGELLALNWDAIDLEAGSLHVRAAVVVNIEGSPKSGRDRVVSVNDAALRLSNEAKGPLRRTRARSGVPHFGWQSLRHSFASHLVMRGVPLKTGQDFLGRATIEYAHLSPDVVRDAVRTLVRSEV